ncbi:PAS domain-containing hybrid sensor histidine kinase/response regulator [Alteromonas sp. C1M14]|uniref:hybrid sensor histidine kinase/response regulator n=1 Tax=Alteromonas sp. C1M14 TaxID=2841567 RepID=UPI001C09D2FE|nr:PAS domain-containing hybrid sensor histidine kinase/response regulator [Alteromonas sp. C1M14]MBU2978845.1 hybrid sensor histidine kinase/response regulator [Alteromonas sp. C1M14]
MFSIWTIGLITVFYLVFLFVIAFWGDKKLKDNQQHPVLYSLGLGIHCTSWAFFGTTTQASQFGWALVPTYAGIILAMAFLFPVILRVSRYCHHHNVSSIADFFALKFQHSHLLAAMVTLLCFIGVIPYIALQLDAISASIRLLSPQTGEGSDTVGLYVAALMALFAILFGTRTLNLTDKHPGLLLTIAVESVIKLVGLTTVGLFVCYGLFNGPFDLMAKAALHPAAREVLYAQNAPLVYASHVLLGVCSLFVLPRQFHMNFVECNGENELRTARWLFPLYLVGMTLFILPIALAGHILLDTNTVSTDAFVLALPLYAENKTVSLIAMIGGLSATTSMIIVATLALGIMIANNLITPIWLKIRLKNNPTHAMRNTTLLTIRRLTVLVVLSVAYWYHVNVSQSAPLVKSGIIAIALLAQLLPAMLWGLYWQKITKRATQFAILTGFVCWSAWLLYPSILSSYYFNPAPTEAELGLSFFACMAVNCVTLLCISLLDRSASATSKAQDDEDNQPDLAIRIHDLFALTARVLEPEVNQALRRQVASLTHGAAQDGFASMSLLSRVEKLLAAQVGTPSARILLSAIAQSKPGSLKELVDWVEEASLTFQFNHEVLQSSVQHIQQGISVLDQELKLLAWNERYLELFSYPTGFLHEGISIQSLLEYNAKRGLLGPVEDVETEIDKRIAYMKNGSRYTYIRKQPDGRVIELNGSPLPHGGYVTTYSDITQYIQIQEQLEAAKSDLEDRVAVRTKQLEQAKLEADLANESKTKFLAAAGHDLMQPFNAATLFASMLRQKTASSELATLSQGLVTSLASAESLLSTLLDMTKLESGVLVPQLTEFALDDVLTPLYNEFSVIAKQKDLVLRYHTTRLIVRSDKKLLRRIVQNLISNAIRYTQQGTILLGVRRKGTHTATIWVCDTGIGIPAHQQQVIFKEFHQLESQANQGLGLGLTIVERISQLLHHPVSLVSEESKGTVFTVTLPRAQRALHKNSNVEPVELSAPAAFWLKDKTILLIENDDQITLAMSELLTDWGATVICAPSLPLAQARCPQPPDLMLVDYHLDSGETGTKTALALKQIWGKAVPGILNTANRDDNIREKATEAGLKYLPKPVKQGALKRLLKQLLK